MLVTHESGDFGKIIGKPTTKTWNIWEFLDFLVMKASTDDNVDATYYEDRLHFYTARNSVVDSYEIDKYDEGEVIWFLVLYVVTWRSLRFSPHDHPKLGHYAAKQLGIESWQPPTRIDRLQLSSEASFPRYALWALCATMGFEISVFDNRADRESIISALAELNTARPDLKQLEMLLGM